MIIVALSGGLASAYCVKLMLDKYPKEQIELYFNDTKWEHKDLYRFLDDLSKHFDMPITYDNDGRSIEDLFFHYQALANNRMPFCSEIMKAHRLQKYYKDGDTLVFGIGLDERHRAKRISEVYQEVSRRKKKQVNVVFPLLDDKIDKTTILQYFEDVNIEIPELYKMGFLHNNCSGGCVRAGKKQWKQLYEILPEVYKQREETEIAIRILSGKDISFLKDVTLTTLRETIESMPKIDFPEDDIVTECIGICSTQN